MGLILAFLVACGPLAPPPAGAASLDDLLEGLQVQSSPNPLPAPAFTLQGSNGRPVSLAALRGKVVFLNFWATWCVPCRNEMPAMERLYHAYRERGLAVVAVNERESKVPIGAFMEELHLTFPAALDADGAVARRFAVRGLPVSFLLDREGMILWKAIGSREWDSPHGRAYFEQVLETSQR